MRTFLFKPEVHVGTDQPTEVGSQQSEWIEVQIDPDDLWPLHRVLARTGMSKATLQRRIKDGTFPRSVITDTRRKTNFWTKISVLGWMDLQRHGGDLKDAYLNATVSNETDDLVQDYEETERYQSKSQGDAFFEMSRNMRHDFDFFTKKYPNLKEWAEGRRHLFKNGEE